MLQLLEMRSAVSPSDIGYRADRFRRKDRYDEEDSLTLKDFFTASATGSTAT